MHRVGAAQAVTLGKTAGTPYERLADVHDVERGPLFVQTLDDQPQSFAIEPAALRTRTRL